MLVQFSVSYTTDTFLQFIMFHVIHPITIGTFLQVALLLPIHLKNIGTVFAVRYITSYTPDKYWYIFHSLLCYFLYTPEILVHFVQ